MTASRLKVRYALALVLAQILAGVELTVLVMPLRHELVPQAETVFGTDTLIASVTLSVFGFAGSIGYAILVVDRRLRWFTAGESPSHRDRVFVENFLRHQSALLTAIWLISGTILFIVNRDGGAAAAWLIGMLVLFGTTTSAGAALLLIQRPMRPITAAVMGSTPGRDTAPGVLPRLLLMWVMSSALPSIGIAVVVLMRASGWIIQKNASIEIPVIVLSVISVLVGLRGMAIVAVSISDPVHDVVAAMAKVERGQIGTRVDVYERSEIGRLQSGFNRMVAGLAERDRLRDLFGRHVGTDVALRAVSDADSLTGEVREAAVLFVDLVGSTQLAQSSSPAEVAGVLNDFFQIVVDSVDERHGLINKFQGDAVLAVFGAPLPSARAASDALATARALTVALRRLPVVDFGIGVSAGRVFAGNIGAEHRYEYTVIGDPVNEAARLADRAKATGERALCSAVALANADGAERAHWVEYASEVLRGRLEPTRMSAPTA
ncbi:adenylate/guanylate cyclase domain-containing protein [Mycolicibacterium aichiense]|uniref:Adenylate cyclase n=1 Tax=Mycolicibacterium aichiense TaxID=1799 RepID=A0AAD1HU14_9MYCO|nr:adenylate/guanylate cyclase domain-containing protein [Mycolicibacterium aichiense]MCV7018761.1 adenylate/guanylate cyclase domain-containing protein [Mycolicibacterium aichiense]BBX10763.1 putative adenylate cyclase [Mycolicibacterium aichiense]STZ25580.1 adenylate cyclase, family protein 3 [Mycolicibacterium aichiense]